MKLYGKMTSYALLLFVVILLLAACSDTVEVDFWTNDTKAEWVHEVTGPFNEAQHQTASGKTIVVNVEQLSSGDVYPLIEAGEIEPTAWSPGTIAWINEANVAWQEEHGAKPLTSGDCPEVVYTAIGIGMWRPMAEAMGWPEVNPSAGATSSTWRPIPRVGPVMAIRNGASSNSATPIPALPIPVSWP